MLQTTYTQHEDKGGNTQLFIKKVVKFKMRSECKYNQNNSIGIKLLCGRIRGTCMGDITSRPETDTELNNACRAVTGCLKPTNVEDLYLLAGIAPLDIRRDVCARMGKKQETNEAHSLYGQHPAERRLKYRSYGVMNGLGDYKQHHTKLLST